MSENRDLYLAVLNDLSSRRAQTTALIRELATLVGVDAAIYLEGATPPPAVAVPPIDILVPSAREAVAEVQRGEAQKGARQAKATRPTSALSVNCTKVLTALKQGIETPLGLLGATKLTNGPLYQSLNALLADRRVTKSGNRKSVRDHLA